MSARKFYTWRASHQCGLYNASVELICWRELVGRGHIRWDCSVWGCPCSRSWLLVLAPPWTCPPLWSSPKSYQCFLDEGEEHYICLGPVSLPLLGDGLFHLALADHKKKREGQSLFEASSKECCGALVLFRRVTASSAQVLCFILKNQHVVIAVFAYRLFLFRWDRCLLYQVDRKYHGRFLILPFIVCLVLFDPLLLLFLSHNLVIFLHIDRREKCHKSWFLLWVKVCNVRSTLCFLWLKSGSSNHRKEPSSKIHWIFDRQSAIFTDTGSLVLVQNRDMHISFGSLGHLIY